MEVTMQILGHIGDNVKFKKIGWKLGENQELWWLNVAHFMVDGSPLKL